MVDDDVTDLDSEQRPVRMCVLLDLAVDQLKGEELLQRVKRMRTYLREYRPRNDKQIQRQIAWLKTNQRQSGCWWMKSLSFAGDKRKNDTTYTSTAQALRTLALRGKIAVLPESQ